MFYGFPILALICFLSEISSALAQSKTGLNTAVTVDLMAEFAADDETTARDHLFPRDMELSLFGAIDHQFDGLVSIAVHGEDEEAFVELHEAYISTSRLISGMNLKLGQSFVGIGRLNRTHRHEWPFISAPKVQEEFFAGEGILDQGFEGSYLLPLPFYLDLTAGVTNGMSYGQEHGHDHEEAEETHEDRKPRKPLTYLRMASFFSLGSLDVKPAINYLQHKAADKKFSRLWGADITAKYKTGKTLTWLLQSEVWRRQIEHEDGESEEEKGGYLYTQYGMDSGIAFGLRYDWFSEPLEEGDQKTFAWVPGLSYQGSEFSRWRFAINQQTTKIPGQADDKQTVYQLSSTFILGAHPAHAF